MENIKYEEITKEALGNIKLIRYLRIVRRDNLMRKYKELSRELLFQTTFSTIRLRGAYQDRHLFKAGKLKLDDTIKEGSITRQQFDSCSYNELTWNIKIKITSIREYQEFLNDETITGKYPFMKTYVEYLLERSEKEIRRLLKMRRVLKKSKYRNWDSDFLSVDIEPLERYDLYTNFIK